MAQGRTYNTYKIESWEQCEKDYICRLMIAAKGDIKQAVKLSGLSMTTIYRKIARYGVQRAN